MSRTFLDADVFLYALGVEYRFASPCRRILTLVGGGSSTAETSVEVLQEVVHIRRHGTGDLEEAVARIRNILALGLPVHGLSRDDFELALDLQLGTPSLSSRDAIHVATMRNREIGRIISADRDFDTVEGIERLDPLAASALTALSH